MQKPFTAFKKQLNLPAHAIEFQHHVGAGEAFRQGGEHTEVAGQAERGDGRGAALFGGIAAQVLSVAVSCFGGQRTHDEPGGHRSFSGKGDVYNCPRIASLCPLQDRVQVERLPRRVLQSNILPMHTQQNVSSGFGHSVDAPGARQSSVSTNQISRLRPITIQSLTSSVIGNFNSPETTLGRIIDDVQRPRLQALHAEQVEAQLMRHMKASKDNVRSLSSSLRCFLSYCAIHGYTQSDFSGLVPRQRQYRHAALPRGIEDSAIERVLAAIDKQTPNGVRDYAIVLLLMAYGIRAISACQLLLDDIDWQQAKIRFRAQKGGKEVVVPLLDAVAEAIIQWLHHRDPRTPYREVFLSTKAPHGPLASMAISTVVKHYMHKAGVHQPGRGAHTLRHSWAIRALEHDQPIKAIADALGHRYIDTTYIYAKADLKTLRQVAMPWPRR